MAVVTGDRYLDLLHRFVEKHAGELLDGSVVLKLNPVGLHYLQTRLEALQELERLRTGAPVDYLRAYIADLGDHRVLEQLSRVLRLLPSVKIVSVLPRPARDVTPVTLLPFGRLRSLELRGCDLSTSAARGLLELRPSLEKLICHNSADALRHIFAERTAEVQYAQHWSRLTSVSCAYNGMLLMDETLQLLPVVQFLDLSRNRFAKVAHLHRCLKLKYLDLSFNQLRTVSPLNQQAKSKLSKLVLRNNALVSLDGIQNLTTLEVLDISYNMISNFSDIELLAALPLLEILWLEGNPIAFTTFYRQKVLSFFSPRIKVQLDGRKITRLENWAAKFVFSKRHKRRSVYGQYAPAENVTAPSIEMPADDEALSSTVTETGALPPTRVKRKISRLASIEEARSRNLVFAEGPEQEESPRFHRICPNSEDAEERTDSGGHDSDDVLELMHKVETLKQDGSKTWLKELKRLLEKDKEQSTHTSELSVEEETAFMGSKWRQVRKRRCRRQKDNQRRAKDFPASLSNGYNSEEGSESQAEDSFEDWRFDSLSSESFDISRVVSSTDVTQPCGSQSIVPHFGAQLKADTANYNFPAEKNLADLKFGETASYIKDRSKTGCIGDGKVSLDDSHGLPRVADDSVESHASCGYPVTPPQYHKDLLQKRQYLEEELLRLPLDSGYGPLSSDSETSSDGSQFQVSGSSSPTDSPNVQFEFNRLNINYEAMPVQAEQSSYEHNSELTNVQENKIAVAAAAADETQASSWRENNAFAAEVASTSSFNPASAAYILSNATGCEAIERDSTGDFEPNFKKKKKKTRRRVVNLE